MSHLPTVVQNEQLRNVLQVLGVRQSDVASESASLLQTN